MNQNYRFQMIVFWNDRFQGKKYTQFRKGKLLHRFSFKILVSSHFNRENVVALKNLKV